MYDSRSPCDQVWRESLWSFRKDFEQTEWKVLESAGADLCSTGAILGLFTAVGGLKWHWAFVRLQEQIVGFTIPVILRAT
jgi:hypothetical protein